MPIHSMSRCYNTLYIQYEWCMESEALYTLNHDTPHSIIQVHPYPIPKSRPHLHKCYSVRVRPYAHQQHIIVLYVLYPKWKWDGVWSCLQPKPWYHTESFGFTHTPFSHYPLYPLPAHLHKCYSERVHPYAHPQHVKVQKHYPSDIEVGWEFESVYTLNHDTYSVIQVTHIPFS